MAEEAKVFELATAMFKEIDDPRCFAMKMAMAIYNNSNCNCNGNDNGNDYDN